MVNDQIVLLQINEIGDTVCRVLNTRSIDNPYSLSIDAGYRVDYLGAKTSSNKIAANFGIADKNSFNNMGGENMRIIHIYIRDGTFDDSPSITEEMLFEYMLKYLASSIGKVTNEA